MFSTLFLSPVVKRHYNLRQKSHHFVFASKDDKNYISKALFNQSVTMPHGQCDQDNVLYSLSLAGSLLSLDLPFTYEYTKWCKMNW